MKEKIQKADEKTIDYIGGNLFFVYSEDSLRSLSCGL